MASGAVGFKAMTGLTIVKVDDRACNVVVVKTSDGKTYDIEAEVKVVGNGMYIPILTFKEFKKEKHA